MKKKKECKQKIPPWMATFSDMVTLLLVFFVMLLASGEVKIIKTFIILSSFEGKLGVLKGGQSLDEGQFEFMGQSFESLTSNKKMQSLSKSVKNTVSKILKLKKSRNIRVEENERGIVISLMTDVLFDYGTAKIRLKENKELLENLRVIIDNLDIDNRVIFEGHADDHPIIDPRFKDQWDLSIQRAWAILKAISSIPSIKSFKRDIVSIKGFGDTRPLDDNKSPESSMYNRRVDIVITASDH